MRPLLRKTSIYLPLISGGIMAATIATSAQGLDANAQFRALADQYFEQSTFAYNPTFGTMAGLHQYDSKLENYSRASVDAEIMTLHDFEKKFDDQPAFQMDQSTQADREMVLNDIRARLLTLQVIKPWEKNTDNYSSGITNSAFVLMERNFAPPDERLRSLIAREKQMPAVFAAAQKNLKNPPHIYTEIALEQLPGIISFFETDVPEAFKNATDAATKAEFKKTNAQVIEALKSYQSWLKQDLLPKSNGDFRLG